MLETSLLRKQMPELDAVRGVAIALVLAYHGIAWSNPFPGEHIAQRLVRNLASVGWLGVDLFLVLSGFLITGILLDNRTVPARSYFRSFYLRRALRILPLYYLTLICVAAVLWPSSSDGVSVWFFGMSLVDLPNIGTWLGARRMICHAVKLKNRRGKRKLERWFSRFLSEE